MTLHALTLSASQSALMGALGRPGMGHRLVLVARPQRLSSPGDDQLTCCVCSEDIAAMYINEANFAVSEFNRVFGLCVGKFSGCRSPLHSGAGANKSGQ